MDEEDLNQSKGKEEQHLTHKVEIVVAVVLGSMLFAFACAIMAPHFGMKPNELGDFFAGVFAPLAFAGIAVGLYLQHRSLNAQYKELKLQREEMKLQREEFAKMAIETAEMSKESAKANDLQETLYQDSKYRKWISSNPRLYVNTEQKIIGYDVYIDFPVGMKVNEVKSRSHSIEIERLGMSGGFHLVFKNERVFDQNSVITAGFYVVTNDGSHHEYELEVTLSSDRKYMSCELNRLDLLR